MHSFPYRREFHVERSPSAWSGTNVDLAGVFFDDEVLAGAVLDALSVEVDDWDWVAAGDEKPILDRMDEKRIPAKSNTAKRRTQPLPSAES